MYTSQDVSDASGDTATPAAARTRSWKTDAGEHWNVPGLLDTLGLCYLGAVLLRLPFRVGDFYRWAKKDQIVFLGAVGNLVTLEDLD